MKSANKKRHKWKWDGNSLPAGICKQCGAKVEHRYRISTHKIPGSAIDKFYISPTGEILQIRSGVTMPPCEPEEQ